MTTVNIRGFSRHASAVIDGVASSGRPTLITRRGAPIVAVVPIDSELLEDAILQHSSEYLADLIAANNDLAAGNTRSADDVFAELEHDDAG